MIYPVTKNGQLYNGCHINTFNSHKIEKWSIKKLQFINPYSNSSTNTPINNCHKWKCASNTIEVIIFCVFLQLIVLESIVCILNNYHLHISWQVHLINSSAELNLIQVLPLSIFERLDSLPRIYFWKNPCSLYHVFAIGTAS